MLYELTIITPEETTEMGIEQLERAIRRYATEISKKADDGVRRLAYHIMGHDRGRFLFYEINLEQGKPQELCSRLNINDKVLRYLLVKADTGVKR